MFKLKTLVLATSTMLFLNACTMVGPDYKQPDSQVEAQWQSYHGSVSSGPMQDAQWWKSFNDPVLNALIEQGYTNNPSLQSTGVNILKARATLGQSVGELYPQSQAIEGNYTHQEMGEGSQYEGVIPSTFDTSSISAVASWEMDFWGKYRRAIRANDAGFLASIAAYDDALVSLTAEIGSSYISIRSYQAQIIVTTRNILAQKISLKIIQAQYDVGQADLISVQEAIASLKQTQASLPGIKISLEQEKDALAVLLGTTPNKVHALVKTEKAIIPVAPSSIAVGIPKEVLEQRPDVKEAQLEAIEQSEAIGATKAQLYPALSLVGSFGYSTSDVNGSSNSDLFKWSNHTVSIGPSLYLPLFNYGQITNQVREQDAAFQQAIFNYQNVVLTAQQEVQDGIVSYAESKKSLKDMEEANNAALTGLQLIIVQYQAGAANYSNVLSALQQQLNVELSLINAQTSVPQGAISLYRALGGGWQISQGHDVVSEQTKEQMAERTNWGNLLETSNHEAPTDKSEQLKQTLLPSW
jgi:NodT family efflux transporter outer membrane factor (OMF) lipoprotein